MIQNPWAYPIPINLNFIDLTGDKDNSNDNESSSESIDEPLKFGDIEGLDAMKIYSLTELKRMGINFKEGKKIYGNKKEGVTDFFCSEKNIVDENHNANSIIKILFKSGDTNSHTYMLNRSDKTKSPIRVFRKVREKNNVRFEGLYLNKLIKDSNKEIEYHLIKYSVVMIDITEDEANNDNESSMPIIISQNKSAKKNGINNNEKSSSSRKRSLSSSSKFNDNYNNINNNNDDIIITKINKKAKEKEKEKDKDKNNLSNNNNNNNNNNNDNINNHSNSNNSNNSYRNSNINSNNTNSHSKVKPITSYFPSTAKNGKTLSKESTTSKNGKTSNISPPQSSSKNNIASDLKAKINKTLSYRERETNTTIEYNAPIENNKVPKKISGNLFDFEDDFFVVNNKKTLSSPIKKKKKIPQRIVEKKRLSEFIDSEEPCKKSRFLIFEEEEKITCTFCHLSFDMYNYDKHLILHRSKLVSDDIIFSKIVHQSKTRSIIEKLDEK